MLLYFWRLFDYVLIMIGCNDIKPRLPGAALMWLVAVLFLLLQLSFCCWFQYCAESQLFCTFLSAVFIRCRHINRGSSCSSSSVLSSPGVVEWVGRSVGVADILNVMADRSNTSLQSNEQWRRQDLVPMNTEVFIYAKRLSTYSRCQTLCRWTINKLLQVEGARAPVPHSWRRQCWWVHHPSDLIWSDRIWSDLICWMLNIGWHLSRAYLA